MNITEESNEETKKIEIIAFYLAQFDAFPENDQWWGKGFTEWTNVKKSKPLYKGHYQPTIPLNQNFYTLEDIKVMEWQAGLARKYGISGFCFYHYWFGNGRQLMEKPVDNYLIHTEIDFPFCLCWANHNWSRTWVGGDKDILIEVEYGDKEEWERHFQYLLPFFKDRRYMLMEEKPILVIYQPQLIDSFGQMVAYLQSRAKEEGLNGLTIIAQDMFFPEKKEIEDYVDYKIQYEPDFSRKWAWANKLETLRYYPPFLFDLFMYKAKGRIKKTTKGKVCKVRTCSYNSIWKYNIRRKNKDRKMIPGAFVKCDVTPRRQDRALIFRGNTPEKFGEYMREYILKCKMEGKHTIFLSAWNEWGEGMYLEPDEKDGYKYLEGVRDAVV